VCINQQDASEKSLQVRKMGEIYSDAERVLVWLGKEDCVAGVAQLQRIGQDCQLYGFEKVFPFPLKIRDHAATENLEALVQSCDGAAVLELLDREWFERVWIVQEFILAKNLVVCSERSEISYGLFSKAICVLRLMARRPALLRLIVEKESLLRVLVSGRLDLTWGLIQMRERHLAWNAQDLTTACDFPTSLEGSPSDAAAGEVENSAQGSREKGLSEISAKLPEYPLERPIHRSTLVEYCVGARTLKCTNERDRVFGMLGFAGDTLSIKPDYNSSPEKVWNDLAVKSLLSGDLTVLHWARGVPSDGSAKGFSFVADLGNSDSEAPRLGGNGTPKFQAGSQVAAQVELLTPGLPKLRGAVIDSINSECFLGLQGRTLMTGEESAVTSNSSTGVDEHGQEQRPAVISKENLIQLFKICQSWLSESSFQYEEGFAAAFARTTIADNALPLTQELIGNENGILVLYLVLHLLSQNLSGIDDGRLFVPDTDVAKSLGGSFSLGLQTFQGDEPKFCHFPAEDGPDLILTNPDDNTTQTLVEITEPLKTRLNEYKGAVSQLLTTRNLFSTAKGCIGLGPKGMAQDDDVVVFQGAQTPFVLRRAAVFVS
jgi:hypothetical protein